MSPCLLIDYIRPHIAPFVRIKALILQSWLIWKRTYKTLYPYILHLVLHQFFLVACPLPSEGSNGLFNQYHLRQA